MIELNPPPEDYQVKQAIQMVERKMGMMSRPDKQDVNNILSVLFAILFAIRNTAHKCMMSQSRVAASKLQYTDSDLTSAQITSIGVELDDIKNAIECSSSLLIEKEDNKGALNALSGVTEKMKNLWNVIGEM